MHLNEQTANTNEEKAELFNLFFQSVFNSKISKVENQFNFEEKDLNRFDISEKEIESILNKLDTSKANGSTDMSNLFLKNLSKTISRALLLLFQTFINKSKFPPYWKQGDITPIHIEGDKAAINMYRPISCLCCLSQVFEKFMFKKLYEHVKGTLHDSQFGFRPQRSAIIQMLCFLDQLYKELDSIAHHELFVFYLDFQKAFDTVPHHSVVAKLTESGIGEKALRLIANYCDDRKQVFALEHQSRAFVTSLAAYRKVQSCGLYFFSSIQMIYHKKSNTVKPKVMQMIKNCSPITNMNFKLISRN